MKITSFMLPSLVVAAIVVTCAAGPAWAEQVPRGVQADERIKTVIYRPDDVIGLSASYGISTMVQFGESEKIETVALGNSVAWQVIPNKKGNMLFIKPVEPRAATNMNVVTDRRVYTFALQGGPASLPDQTFRVRFRYPEEEADDRLMRAAEQRAQFPNLKGLRRGNVNTEYGYKGSEMNRPAMVFDDGRKTFFRITPGAELPGVFVVGANRAESLVNFRREGDFLVVDKVAHQWTLRHGDQATCVFNLRKPSLQAVASQSLSRPRRLDGSSSLF